MKINRIHVYIYFGLSQEYIPSKLQNKLQEISTSIHLRGKLRSGPMGVYSYSPLRLAESTNLIQRYQQVLSALERLYADVDEESPDLWRVSMAASAQPLALEEEPVGERLPGWVLGEFGSALILDSLVYSHQLNKERFKPFQGKPIFYIWKPEIGVFKVKRRPEKELSKMRNIDPNATPQEITVEDVSIEDLLRLAEVAYADIEVTEQLGGRALLLSFSLERNSNRIEEEKTFTFYNALALGLKYQVQPNSLADHIQKRTIRVLEAIAEPSAIEE